MRAVDLPIPEPCDADWGAMRVVGATTRHCDHCDKAVHDLSAMSDGEARSLLANERVCVRFYSDERGQVMHRPPVRYRYEGRQRVRLSLPRLARRLGLALGLGSMTGPALAGSAVEAPADPETGWNLWAVERLDELLHGVFGPIEEVHRGQVSYKPAPPPIRPMPTMGEPPPMAPTVDVSVSVPAGVTDVELWCSEGDAHGAARGGPVRLSVGSSLGEMCMVIATGDSRSRSRSRSPVVLAETIRCVDDSDGGLRCEPR